MVRSKASTLMSLMVVCAILTGCLGQEESGKLDGDDLLEWWVFEMNETSYELDDDYTLEMKDGDSVSFEYTAPMPADLLLQDRFSISIRCSDGLYAENGMPIPVDEEDTLSFSMRDGNGEIIYDQDEIPCDNEQRTKDAIGEDSGNFDSRYWIFSYQYYYIGAYHSAEEAYKTFENDPDVPSYESVFPITIEITAQTSGEIPGVSEDNSLELNLLNINYDRWDPTAFFYGNYTVDECESMLDHEH